MSSTTYSLLKQLFGEATERVLAEKWQVFYSNHHWQEVLPCPDLSTLPKTSLPRFISNAIGINIPSLKEQQLTWSLWAIDFFNQYKQCINQNLNNMEQYLADDLSAWNKYHPEKNEQLSFEKMYREWLASIGHLSLGEFAKLHIGLITVRQFIEPKYEALKERYGMYTSTKHSSVSISTTKNLSLRQIAHLHIYQNKAISRGDQAAQVAHQYGYKSGEKLYKHYIKHSRTCDRIGVEGREIKPLIEDITAVIPFLSGTQQQQAESEKKTINMKIQDQS